LEEERRTKSLGEKIEDFPREVSKKKRKKAICIHNNKIQCPPATQEFLLFHWEKVASSPF